MTARFGMLLVLWCGVALAQTETLTGSVTNAIDSSPIAGATVILSGGNTSQTVLTDMGGKFVFGGVPDGRYSLVAQRAGYLNSEGPGQRVPTAFASVEVKGKSEPVVLRLTPGATLTGSVTDEAGFPLPSPSVVLIHRQVMNGRGRLMADGLMIGNDAGEFRKSGLAADRYLVCVNANASNYQRRHGLTYRTTCFPGVSDPSSAEWVSLGPGEERKLAFHMTPVPGVRVSGSVDSAGKGTFVSIVRTDPPGFPRLFSLPVTWNEKTASFEIPAVSPGDYLITATGSGARAMRTIRVGNEEIRDVHLRLRDGPYLSGTVRMGDTPVPAPAPALAPGRSFTPAPGQNRVGVSFDGDNRLSIYASASGSFQYAIPAPGDYFVDVLPPPGWSLQAMTQGGMDIRDRKVAIDADADPAPIEIVLGQGGGTVEVSGQDALAKAPTPVRLVLLRRLSTAGEWAQQGQPMVANMGAGRGGALSWRNVPSGEYVLFAWPAANEIEYLNPEVIEKYQSYGQAVSVHENETTRVTVRPIPLE